MYTHYPWLEKIKCLIRQLALPLLIFQFVRLLFFPNAFDVLLLGILFCLYLSVLYDWI
jgi:hypothetical protein